MDKPISLSIIAVIDPLFSLMLISALGIAIHKRQQRWCWFGLVCVVAYLSTGAVQHQRAYHTAEALAEQRGVTPSRIIIKPTLANLFLWRAITIEDGRAWTDAIRVGWSSEAKIYQGTSVTLIEPAFWKDLPPDSRAYRDLTRFFALADRMLVTHPQHENFVGDLRYAMLPDSVEPMWGIRIDPMNPDASTDFVVDRSFTPKMREALIKMLQGK